MSDFLKYAGKTVIVVGAASGIGKATARLLVEYGAKVHALDYAPTDLAGLASVSQANLAVRAEVDAAFAELPTEIDAFFGIAGVSGLQHNYNTTLLINFGAYKYISDTFLEDRMTDDGSIVYVTSTGGLNWEHNQGELEPLLDVEGWDAIVASIEALGLAERPGPAAYPVSKRLLNFFMTTSAAKLAPRGIRVNAVLPASTETGLTQDFETMVGGRAALEGHAGLAKRLATPEEMAEPLLFLNSEAARFVSGVPLLVDFAGRTLQVLGRAEDPYAGPMIRRP